MNISQVQDLLKERIGLNSDSLGRTAIEKPIAERMRQLRLNDPGEYAARIRADPTEFDELVEGLVVVESWFFRGGELFNWLARTIAERAASIPVRILSIPCCTGEEPYSIRMAMEEAGVPARNCSILGVDLSKRVVESARIGTYADFSFRQTPAELRDRYFALQGRLWKIADRVRQNVEFRAGNLVDPEFLKDEPPFDIILCRNLMIYLDGAARVRALANIQRLLVPGGVLAMGHAEPLREKDFETLEPSLFLYRRRTGSVVEVRPTREIPPPVRSIAPVVAAPPAEAPLRVPRTATKKVDPFTEVKERADRGDIATALELCRKLLEADAANPGFHSMMGVLYLAQGDSKSARESFGRVLYLEPDHRDALVHLMHLSRAGGDLPKAELYRQRLERLGPGGDA